MKTKPAANTVNGKPNVRSVAHTERLKRLLDERDPTFRARVERSWRQCNQAVREILRNETGMRLGVEESHRAIRVLVVDGLPANFSQILSEEFDPIVWRLLLNQSQFASGISIAKLFQTDASNIFAWLGVDAEHGYDSQLESVSRLFQHALDKIEKHPLSRRLYSIHDDILGTYYATKPEVNLYWMVIALVASNLSISVEALTVIVVAHELAHAYTHAGVDKDGESWDTDGFYDTALSVKEGLAQHYTEAVVSRLAARFPDAPGAFSSLLARQPPPYTKYKEWLKPDEKPAEIMRAALLDARRAGTMTESAFIARVEDHSKRLGGRRKSGRGLPLIEE